MAVACRENSGPQVPRVITLVFVNNIMRNCDGSDLSGDYFRKLKE